MKVLVLHYFLFVSKSNIRPIIKFDSIKIYNLHTKPPKLMCSISAFNSQNEKLIPMLIYAYINLA